MIKLKTIRYTILNLKKFENIIKTPREINLPDDANIIDFILELDKCYFKEIKEKKNDGLEGFHDDYIRSLLQLMWNPQRLKFYEDVGLGARSPAPKYKYLPVSKEVKGSTKGAYA